MKIFIAAKLRDSELQLLNQKIDAICRKLGFKTWLPQRELPLDTIKIAQEILEANESAVRWADIGLVVFDKASEGVAMEVGEFRALGKLIIGYRSPESERREDLGKMMQGVWDSLPKESKATTLQELEATLKQLALQGVPSLRA